MYQAITTKYIGATDTKGARVKATNGYDSVTIPYASDLEPGEAHRKAARAFCDKFGYKFSPAKRLLHGAILGKTGYVFIPTNHIMPKKGV